MLEPWSRESALQPGCFSDPRRQLDGCANVRQSVFVAAPWADDMRQTQWRRLVEWVDRKG